MGDGVDVRVDWRDAAGLAPSALSIVDGGEAGVTVRTRVLCRPLGRRIEMSVTVDPATAGRFARASRWQAVWERRVFPGTLIGVAVLGTVGIIGLVRDDSRLMLGALLLLLVQNAGILAGQMAMALLRSPHHPRFAGRDEVLIRRVNREAAVDWQRRNSLDAVRPIG